MPYLLILILAIFLTGGAATAGPNENAYKNANENASFKRDGHKQTKNKSKKKDKSHKREKDGDDDATPATAEEAIVDGVIKIMDRKK